MTHDHVQTTGATPSPEAATPIDRGALAASRLIVPLVAISLGASSLLVGVAAADVGLPILRLGCRMIYLLGFKKCQVKLSGPRAIDLPCLIGIL
jgi:hypothetical protein